MTTDNTKSTFDTRFNYQKRALEGRQTVSIPSQTWNVNNGAIAYTTVTIPHNLGVIPTARIFFFNGNDMLPFPMPYGGQGTIDGTPSSGWKEGSFGAGPYTSVLVDKTNLTLRITNTTGATQTYDILWRLYYDTSN